MSIIERAKQKYQRDGLIDLLRSLPAHVFTAVGRTLPPPIARRLSNSELRDRGELHRYWETRNDGSASNSPRGYLKPLERSHFLLELVEKYADESSRILEPGCNVGRNLNLLHQAGYRDLTGIELNSNAIDLLCEHYPGMAEAAHIEEGKMEEILPETETDSFDLCFTMAVLEHVHPESEFIFEELSRVTCDFLITIEDEGTVSPRHVPRNYDKIFTGVGFELIETIPREEFPEAVDFGSEFVARVFKKP